MLTLHVFNTPTQPTMRLTPGNSDMFEKSKAVGPWYMLQCSVVFSHFAQNG